MLSNFVIIAMEIEIYADLDPEIEENNESGKTGVGWGCPVPECAMVDSESKRDLVAH